MRPLAEVPHVTADVHPVNETSQPPNISHKLLHNENCKQLQKLFVKKDVLKFLIKVKPLLQAEVLDSG